MFNWIKLKITLLRWKIYKWWLELDEFNKDEENITTYTLVCLHCYKPNQYVFYGIVPSKHNCFHCGKIF